MPDSRRADIWASGEAYEPYVGRWSRLVAKEFLAWLAVPAGREWLDVGCGTGALSELILRSAAPRRTVGIDPAEGFIAFARQHVAAPGASFRIGDAQSLPVDDDAFDCVVSGLVINFVPDQAKAVAELRRVARPGAIVAAYVWDYAGEMQMMRHFWDAAVALNPAARELDEGVRFPVCRPDPFASLFKSAGLQDVSVKAIDVPTVFRDFDDYWLPFLSGQAPAPGYCMSLSEQDRLKLRDKIKSALPIRADGSIHLVARAWAVRGVK
jgi:SAM-dependent methyltransferase